MIGTMEDDEAKGEELHIEEIIEEEELEVINSSLNSVVGITNPKTMKLLGKIGEHELIVMIDLRATNNFTSNQAVQTLGIKCEECDKFGVRLGNGEEILGKGVCRQGTQMMQFTWQGQKIILIGDPSLKRSKISLKVMLKVLRKKSGGILVEFNGIENCIKGATVPVELQELFDSYSDINQSQLQLPPHRTQDHVITLKEETNPINVRPYRYLHSQKNEIERLVHDMLKAGIIQPSISQFSSPLILVKRKTDLGDFAWTIGP